jgi:hypothetical protein
VADLGCRLVAVGGELDAVLQPTVKHGLEGVRGGVEVRRVEKRETRPAEVVVGALLALVPHATDTGKAAVTRDVLVAEATLAEATGGLDFLL